MRPWWQRSRLCALLFRSAVSDAVESEDRPRRRGYAEGQELLVYLVTSVQAVQRSGARFVFTDGHGLATFTIWYDDVRELHQVDWGLVGARYWTDTSEDNDRRRRKQAEFLVWQSLDWSLIRGIGVFDGTVKARVATTLGRFPDRQQPKVAVKRDWYYY
ncbi:DUF4433 domain-containing protein [Halochromatium roseum]|uniref:DUF4433 domain-containing protein n=1 Tax=Halochromatium roseum TaxID=391920 RepID=UPI00237B4C56|nr:DUF4433 domain-containing protein [Halochromatium roseum]